MEAIKDVESAVDLIVTPMSSAVAFMWHDSMIIKPIVRTLLSDAEIDLIMEGKTS